LLIDPSTKYSCLLIDMTAMAAIGSSSSRKQQAITMVLVLLWLGVVVVPPAASCGGHPCMIADSGVGTGGGKTRSQSKNRA